MIATFLMFCCVFDIYGKLLAYPGVASGTREPVTSGGLYQGPGSGAMAHSLVLVDGSCAPRASVVSGSPA